MQNPQSIIHTQINPAAILKMKTTVFPYYKALYQRLGLYEQNKAAICRYLVDAAPENNLPTDPLDNMVADTIRKWDGLTMEAANAVTAAARKKQQEDAQPDRDD